LTAAVAVVVLAALGLLVMYDASAATQQEAARRLAGSLVWTAKASDAQPLDSQACDALNRSPGVAAAGGVGATRPPEATAFTGGPPLTVELVTPRTMDVWAASPGAASVAIGRDLEATGGAAVGSTLWFPGGSAAVIRSREPTSVPVARLRSAVVVPTSQPMGLSECWARMSPGAVSEGRELLTFTFRGTGAQVTPFLDTPAGLQSPAAQWHSFASLQVWAVAGLLLGALAGLGTWTRRGEWAIYRTFGTRRVELVAMIAMESIIMTPVVAVSASLVTLFGGTGPLSWEIYLVTGRHIAAAAAVGVVVSLIAAPAAMRGNLLEQLKDR
jgi:hypothetical protein